MAELSTKKANSPGVVGLLAFWKDMSFSESEDW
jgi:hypothetical protein